MEQVRFLYAKVFIGIAIIAVIGLGVYLFSNSKKNSGNQEIVDTTKPMQLTELLMIQGAHKCTFSNTNDISESQGIWYVSDGKGRGDFETNIMETSSVPKTIKSHMIVVDGFTYLWTDGMQQGTKVSLKDTPQDISENTVSSEVAENEFNNTYEFSCESWKIDTSVFILPTDIHFVDIQGMMDKSVDSMNVSKGNIGTESLKEKQCALCEQAGSGREQCLQALGC